MKDRHKLQPVSQKSFDEWYRNPVTQRLFQELELGVVDQFQDYLPEDSVEKIALGAMVRQGAAKTVETVLDWAPDGCRNPNSDIVKEAGNDYHKNHKENHQN